MDSLRIFSVPTWFTITVRFSLCYCLSILCYSSYAKLGLIRMKMADKIRSYGEEKYVVPARQQRLHRFSIRVGDVVRELELNGPRVPAVCSALQTREFLRSNGLKLVDMSGPKSGQSTTVVYTYEFTDTKQSSPPTEDSWSCMRGSLKDVFADMGGGEAYLRAERSNFHPNKGE